MEVTDLSQAHMVETLLSLGVYAVVALFIGLALNAVCFYGMKLSVLSELPAARRLAVLPCLIGSLAYLGVVGLFADYVALRSKGPNTWLEVLLSSIFHASIGIVVYAIVFALVFLASAFLFRNKA